MATGTDCLVYLDGVRIADGQPTDDPTAPTVLSGLSITWGRETTVDQPGPSTCEFTVMDLPGGASAPVELRTGRRVDVTATGLIYADPTIPTAVDPTFDATPIGTRPANVTYVTGRAVVAEVDNPRSPVLRLDPTDATRAQLVTIAPGYASADPAAWDAIPRLVAGQTWRWSIDLKAWRGASFKIQPVGFTDPTATHYAPLGDPYQSVAISAWGTLSGEITATDTEAVWVGLQVWVFPPGPRWVDETRTWATIAPRDASWLDTAAFFIDNVMIYAPAEGIPQEVLVYSGRVTDVVAKWDDVIGGPTYAVTCADFTADLDNVRVGDEPWTVEPMQDRFNRILTLAGLGIDAVIEATVGGIPVSYDDVDSQPATGLLQDLAQSVDGVMWSATHVVSGPYLRVEDPAARVARFALDWDEASQLVVIVPLGGGEGVVTLSACDALRDPVEWQQTVSDIATRVSVGWLEQGVDDDGNTETTDRTYTTVDAPLEETYGQRGISVSTLLADETDAADVAGKILARQSVVGWRISGLTVDDATLEISGSEATELILTLLDGTARIALPLDVVDLPSWSPLGSTSLRTYLEGGQYSFVDGAWILALTVSRATGIGASGPWTDLDPAWRWVDFSPAVKWSDLYGVST